MQEATVGQAASVCNVGILETQARGVLNSADRRFVERDG